MWLLDYVDVSEEHNDLRPRLNVALGEAVPARGHLRDKESDWATDANRAPAESLAKGNGWWVLSRRVPDWVPLQVENGSPTFGSLLFEVRVHTAGPALRIATLKGDNDLVACSNLIRFNRYVHPTSLPQTEAVA